MVELLKYIPVGNGADGNGFCTFDILDKFIVSFVVVVVTDFVSSLGRLLFSCSIWEITWRRWLSSSWSSSIFISSQSVFNKSLGTGVTACSLGFGWFSFGGTLTVEDTGRFFTEGSRFEAKYSAISLHFFTAHLDAYCRMLDSDLCPAVAIMWCALKLCSSRVSTTVWRMQWFV